MKQYSINGQSYACKIHQRNTERPYLLMLHGFMGDRRVFSHLIDELTAFCNPVTVDLLGFGESSKPSTPERYCTQQQTGDIISIIERLPIGSVSLFGYSMGGRLAMQTALRDTDLITGLLLESTNSGISDPDKRRHRQELDAKWAGEITDNFDQFLADWKELDLFQSPVHVDESLATKYRRIQSGQCPTALAASLHGFGTGSMPPAYKRLEKLELPVLLLAGSADKKYQRINRYLVNQFPNATFSSIKAGHRTHLDNPTDFTAALKHYFNKNT